MVQQVVALPLGAPVAQGGPEAPVVVQGGLVSAWVADQLMNKLKRLIQPDYIPTGTAS